ncbi:MAG: serine hydrolase [Candidatus Delongbacteria bacterium]|nr:serine hydrolase [Candidatus Delongbacteria bacterium]
MKNKLMNLKCLGLLIVLIISLNVNAQISERQIGQIDSLFIDWNTPNHPGGSIGVMKDDKIVFSKSYGLASLEYLVPNSTETIYNIASVSKQFTAMGIVLLDIQGKLSIDDDIRKYLTDLPDFGETITIRHMLHHTSGLRSLHAMLGLAGWRSDDLRTNEDNYRFMKMQKDLNFKPGSEFMYCNTGYMLMVKIIEKVTAEKFPDWMKKNIFEPLGMNQTYVEDQYNRVVTNNATSYNINSDGNYLRAVEYWGYTGSGNMHSTTNDLLKWLNNFNAPQSNWEEPFKQMKTLDKLNNGSDNSYAFGIFINKYLGPDIIQHGGSIGGFNTYVGTCPEEKLSIVVLTNFSSSSCGSKASQIYGILLPAEEEKEEEKVDADNSQPVKKNYLVKQIDLSNDELKKYESSYWNDEENYTRKIYLKNDTLRYFRSSTSESPIVPIGNDEFQMLNVSVDLRVKFIINGKLKSMIVTVDDGEPISSQGFEPRTMTTKDLLSYTGKFYSPELETTYDVFLENGTLFCHHSRHGEFEMKVLKSDVLESEWPMALTKYKRDKKGEVTGFYVSNGRVRNLWFEKQK